MSDFTWNQLLRDQIEWHWQHQLRARLEGMSDEEYFWEPAPGSWNVRPRGTGTAPVQGGSGEMTIDFAFPEPVPAPMTTIAWRLGHVLVGVLAARNAAHFGGPAADYESFRYATTAEAALAQLDEHYGRWLVGVAALGEEELRRPCGPTEGGFAGEPMATLVLLVHRELIHHLAEVALLRDLYAHTHREGN
ncbi:DinB family protein [Kineococcus sp. SYSU DK003]|uniref:DinB family protein n=1 Tax=Kineococcus sp. SYSU DK003 TaxID=3383124 RepID=UPI003D7D1E0A